MTSIAMRLEHDLLGDREVPDTVYYGVHTARALDNFPITGIPISRYPELVVALACVKLAAARANRRLGLLDAERADAGNRYNTYVHDGLPPAPISNPGDLAINAVTKMATGNWEYFVTVNLETGETVFSDTYAQHLVAVKQFQAWLRAHPDYQ